MLLGIWVLDLGLGFRQAGVERLRVSATRIKGAAVTSLCFNMMFYGLGFRDYGIAFA